MVIIAAVLACTFTPAKVTLDFLFREMTDLSLLAEVPAPFFKQAQASSYDRASTKASAGESWFANGDAGKFVRIEDHDGRREFVMADLEGPGVVNRIWSANPSGRIRFYFDGSDKPAISERLADLLSGKAKPFIDPFSYGCARGWNLYFPIPYAKRLVITVDESNGEKVGGLYYHVGHRKYPSGTAIDSYSVAEVERLKDTLSTVAGKLRDPSLIVPTKAVSFQRTFAVEPGSEVEFFTDNSGGSVVELRFQYLGTQGLTDGPADNPELDWTDSSRIHNVLRHTILNADFDGVRSISAPIGDFFACAAGPTAYKSLPFEVTSDGTMICRFVMPYAKMARFALEYEGVGKPLFNTTVRVSDRKPGPSTLRFRAQFLAATQRTRPMADMPVLRTTGEGRFVGVAMHVANPTTAWWGEGDEKIYVDGEPFPSTFGTGTEDYFGYAWCDPTVFTRPYNGQPRADGPANKGHVNVFRWQILDSMPFTSSFQFDLEMWHWADVVCSFDRMAYWYARATDPQPHQVLKSQLQLVEIPKPKPVKGAIEGEDLAYSTTGGGVERQGGFPDLSSGLQLWWTQARAGDRLTLKFVAPDAGQFEIMGNFCSNRDYGIHELLVNGKTLETVDFFSDDLKWSIRSLGTVTLSKGENTLDVVSKGHRKEALGGNMFGLDYLILKKVTPRMPK